jgi:hypothetical protein
MYISYGRKTSMQIIDSKTVWKRPLERRRCGGRYIYSGENWLRYCPVAGFFVDGDETSPYRAQYLSFVHMRNAGGIRRHGQ